MEFGYLGFRLGLERIYEHRVKVGRVRVRFGHRARVMT